ncbi:hypothetical protein JXJ21_03015 [candidate division KSB1 bacterium]|nr:hypothetical protein [candidate division KSB1 bacterium]
MKNILLFGKNEAEKSALADVSRMDEYLITKTESMKKALKIMRNEAPDYVICAGTIRLNAEGKYYLEL